MVQKRKTIQMQKILDYLSSVKTHPKAETVYKAVKKDIPSITLATVYRNLNKLAEDGMISKLEVNGEFRFDADCSLHEHCICKNCGEIFEYLDKKLPKKILKNFKSKKFSPTSVNVIFYGVCTKCKKKMK